MSDLPVWKPSEFPSHAERLGKEEDDVHPLYANRICKDIKEFFTDPIPDIMLCPDSKNMLISHAIIIGPESTPYEGGFFYFFIKLPSNYPFTPPMITLMTTDQNTVRFNPNLYKCGKVCLSILNTWKGPQWSSGLTLSKVLLSIQSIMNDEPFYNEPGASGRGNNSVKEYNNIILHETIRVAVIGMLQDSYDTKNMPSVLKEFITKYFKTKIAYYEKVVDDNMRLDGMTMMDPFREPRGLFQYKKLKLDIEKLKGKYSSEQ